MAEKGHGGNRKGAGRKTVAEGEKLKDLIARAIVKTFGSEEAFIKHGLDKAKSNFNYYRLMMEHQHGKATEHKIVEGEVTHIDWSDE